MPQPEDAQHDRDQPSREDEADHDLLTFGEVGVRLQEQMTTLAARLARLQRDPAAGADEVAAVSDRLDALRAAAERNARQPINDENFAKFFGYEGKARRNTT